MCLYIKIKNMSNSLDNPLKDLVYEKTNHLNTSFFFMNKKLIQEADQLWKVSKEESELKKNEKYLESLSKRTSKRLHSKLQEAPKSIVKKEKIEEKNEKDILKKGNKNEKKPMYADKLKEEYDIEIIEI